MNLSQKIGQEPAKIKTFDSYSSYHKCEDYLTKNRNFSFFLLKFRQFFETLITAKTNKGRK